MGAFDGKNILDKKFAVQEKLASEAIWKVKTNKLFEI